MPEGRAEEFRTLTSDSGLAVAGDPLLAAIGLSDQLVRRQGRLVSDGPTWEKVLSDLGYLDDGVVRLVQVVSGTYVKRDLHMVFESTPSMRMLVQTQWAQHPCAFFEFYDVSCVRYESQSEHQPAWRPHAPGISHFALLECEVLAKEVLVVPLPATALGARGAVGDLRELFRD